MSVSKTLQLQTPNPIKRGTDTECGVSATYADGVTQTYRSVADAERSPIYMLECVRDECQL